MDNYLLEYLGTLLICSTLFLTNANPILVGLSYTAALQIGERAEGLFNPLALLVKFFMKRISFYEFGKLLGIQVAAALSVIVIYMVPTSLE